MLQAEKTEIFSDFQFIICEKGGINVIPDVERTKKSLRSPKSEGELVVYGFLLNKLKIEIQKAHNKKK